MSTLYPELMQKVANSPEKKASAEKTALIGPAGDLYGLGIPSAIGYAVGRGSAIYSKGQAEAQAKKKWMDNLLAGLLIPGYTGFHFGKRRASRDYLAAFKEGEKSTKKASEKQAGEPNIARLEDGRVRVRTKGGILTLPPSVSRSFLNVYGGTKGTTGMLTGAVEGTVDDYGKAKAGKSHGFQHFSRTGKPLGTTKASTKGKFDAAVEALRQKLPKTRAWARRSRR